RRHTRSKRDWSSDVCSSDLPFKQNFLQVTECPSAVFHYKFDPFRHDRFTNFVQPLEKFIPHQWRQFSDIVFIDFQEMGAPRLLRSEERRVGKECRCGW